VPNPVLAGTYPDPSVERVGDDYYLVTSTFEYFPGLPVFHSTDLESWKQIGHVIDRADQLDLSTVPSSGGLFAPTIRHHDGTWYVVCTLVGGTGRAGSFVVTADDPAGPWSDPVWLGDATSIDPSLFFDDGRAWLTATRPSAEPAWPDQTDVWLREFDHTTLTLVGDETVLWHGALVGAVWAEGPHLYRRGGWYYLLASEGGTEFNHAVSVARSRDVAGPYVGNPANPVLTHRHLGRDYPVANVGHTDLIVTPGGDWVAFLLASRPYGGHHANLGRETFRAPVVWEDDWPVFAPGTGVVPADPPQAVAPHMPRALEWTQLRTGDPAFARVDVTARRVSLRAGAAALDDVGTPAFVGVRQRHVDCSFSATVDGDMLRGTDVAGPAVRQSESDHLTFTLATYPLRRATVCRTRGGETEVLGVLAVGPGPVTLSIETHGQRYEFWAAQGARRELCAAADGSFLSSQSAGGFLGVWLGLYARGDGPVVFDEVAYAAG
jgi:alpha-N-arabinofuranosidase